MIKREFNGREEIFLYYYLMGDIKLLTWENYISGK